LAQIHPLPLKTCRYYPGKSECYPAADVASTKATYKQQCGGSPTSITLNFASHQVGQGTVRNGCEDQTSWFDTANRLV